MKRPQLQLFNVLRLEKSQLKKLLNKVNFYNNLLHLQREIKTRMKNNINTCYEIEIGVLAPTQLNFLAGVFSFPNFII